MKVGIIGISGRMGREVANLLSEDEISGGVSSNTSDEEFERVVKKSSVVVDFSSSSVSVKAARFCAKHGVPLVCGTTGLSDNDFAELKRCSEHTAILYASNFSIGIFLMSQLIKRCEKILSDFDVSIIDRHHNRKKDAPSGTALFLASQLERTPQILSLRAGGIIGDHICSFTGNDEELVISHRSFSRGVFASGALRCAGWLIYKETGFFSLKDYLNEKE